MSAHNVPPPWSMSQGQPFEETAESLFQLLSFDWDKVEPLAPDLVEGLVADEEVNLLGGHGGVGKGFLTLQIASAIAIGGSVLGHPARQGRVLYYSAEDGRKRLASRMRRLLENMTPDEQMLLKQNFCIIDASELDVLYGPISTGKNAFNAVLGPTADYAKLQKMVDHFDPLLTIVDPASDTFDGNEISKRDVRGFIKLLKRVNPRRKSVVMVNVHIDRASARGHTTGDDGYSGAVQWHNSCRRRLYLQSKKEKDEDTGDMMNEMIFLKVEKNQDGLKDPDIILFRQSNGFWATAVQFAGNLAPAAQTDHAPTVLRLIEEYYQRGQFISSSVAPQAPKGVYPVLSGDPQFPKGLGKKKTIEIVRQLERDGRLHAEKYQRPNRSWDERWKVVPDVTYTAPSSGT